MRRHASLAAFGAAIGSVMRYEVAGVLPNDAVHSFPWATLAVNLLGACAIGVLAALPVVMDNEDRRHFMVTGVLGGFTTFSALAVETAHLADRAGLAVGYVAATFVGGVAAAAFGWKVSAR